MREVLQMFQMTVGCQRCGQVPDHPAALLFHRRDATSLGSNISSYHEGLVAEIAKFDIVCANCHFTIHALEREEAAKSVEA